MTNETTASQPKSIGDDAQGEIRKVHHLKTDPEVFDAVARGAKTHEIRFNDRDFQVGDRLVLAETESTGAAMRSAPKLYPLVYTGRTESRIVSHIQTGYGLADGWCILSFRAPAAQASATIQAAPDERKRFEEFLRGEWKKNFTRGEDEIRPTRFGFGGDGFPGATYWHRETERAWLAWQTRATIEELVMVAEPVDEVKAGAADLEVRQQVTEALGLGRASNASFTWSYLLGCIKDAVELAASTALAAPMVADPAGVALPSAKSEFCFRKVVAEVLGFSGSEFSWEFLLNEIKEAVAVANMPHVPFSKPVTYLRWWARQINEGHGNIGHEEGYEECKKDQLSDDGSPAFPVYAAPTAQRQIDTLAATVKVVPSEALDDNSHGLRYLKFAMNALQTERKLGHAQTVEDLLMRWDPNEIAAPLADKTGGDE